MFPLQQKISHLMNNGMMKHTLWWSLGQFNTNSSASSLPPLQLALKPAKAMCQPLSYHNCWLPLPSLTAYFLGSRWAPTINLHRTCVLLVLNLLQWIKLVSLLQLMFLVFFFFFSITSSISFFSLNSHYYPSPQMLTFPSYSLGQHPSHHQAQNVTEPIISPYPLITFLDSN